MSQTGLEFDLGEMADAIRESTERFAREKIAPLAAEIDVGSPGTELEFAL